MRRFTFEVSTASNESWIGDKVKGILSGKKKTEPINRKDGEDELLDYLGNSSAGKITNKISIAIDNAELCSNRSGKLAKNDKEYLANANRSLDALKALIEELHSANNRNEKLLAQVEQSNIDLNSLLAKYRKEIVSTKDSIKHAIHATRGGDLYTTDYLPMVGYLSIKVQDYETVNPFLTIPEKIGMVEDTVIDVSPKDIDKVLWDIYSVWSKYSRLSNEEEFVVESEIDYAGNLENIISKQGEDKENLYDAVWKTATKWQNCIYLAYLIAEGGLYDLSMSLRDVCDKATAKNNTVANEGAISTALHKFSHVINKNIKFWIRVIDRVKDFTRSKEELAKINTEVTFEINQDDLVIDKNGTTIRAESSLLNYIKKDSSTLSNAVDHMRKHMEDIPRMKFKDGEDVSAMLSGKLDAIHEKLITNLRAKRVKDGFMSPYFMFAGPLLVLDKTSKTMENRVATPPRAEVGGTKSFTIKARDISANFANSDIEYLIKALKDAEELSDRVAEYMNKTDNKQVHEYCTAVHACYCTVYSAAASLIEGSNKVISAASNSASSDY